jgi:ubiquinone/menaquinone biosynthesis C-methylase UbiE
MTPKRAATFNSCEWFTDPLLAGWILRQISGQGEVIVDIGAGTGLMLPLYANSFKQVLAIEPNVHMLQQMGWRREAPNIQVLTGVAERLPLADKSVDVAIAKSSFHHCSDPHLAISEMIRVARRIVAVVEVISPDPLCVPFARRVLLIKEPDRDMDAVYTEASLSTYFRSYGHRTWCMHFDQTINVDQWLRNSDTSAHDINEITQFIEAQPDPIKEMMQIRRERGDLLMLRRMAFVSVRL